MPLGNGRSLLGVLLSLAIVGLVALSTIPLAASPTGQSRASIASTGERVLLSLNYTVEPTLPADHRVGSVESLLNLYKGLVMVPSQEGVLVPVRPFIIALPPGTERVEVSCSVRGSLGLEAPGPLPLPRAVPDAGGSSVAPYAGGSLGTLSYPLPRLDGCARLVRLDRAGSILLAVVYAYPILYTGPSTIIARSLEIQVRAYGVPSGDSSVNVPGWVRLVVSDPGLVSALSSSSSPGYYVATADPTLLPILYPLLRLRAAMGYSVGVVVVPPGSSADYIRGVITSLANNGAKYVLLVGDNDTLPPAYFYAEENFTSYGEGPYKATDLYYALLNGTWDPNGDGKLLEVLDTNGDNIPDYFVEPLPDVSADVMVGRLPFDDPATLSAVINRLVARETGLLQPGVDLLMAEAILKYANEDGSGLPKTDDAVIANIILTVDLPNTTRVYSFARLFEAAGLSPSTYAYDEPLNITNMYAYLSLGPRYVSSGGHGLQERQARKVWVADYNGDGIPESNEIAWPLFQYAGNMTSIGYPGIMYLDACLAGYFDYSAPSLAETLLAKGLGAVVASSRISYYEPGWSSPSTGLYDQEFHYLFFHELLNTTTLTLGEAFYASKYLYATTRQNITFQGEDSSETIYPGFKDFLEYNLLGDPGEPVYIDSASPLTVDYTVQQVVNGEIVSVNVTRNGLPVENARITVMTENAQVLASALTDANGTATLSFLALPGYTGPYYLYAYSSPSPVYNTTLPSPTTAVQAYTIGNATPTGVSAPYFRASIAGPQTAWTGDNVTLMVSFNYNGSLVLPASYEIQVYPSTAYRSYSILYTGAGPIILLSVSSTLPGPVIVTALGVENNYTAATAYTVYFTGEPARMQQEILSAINNGTATILGVLNNYYSSLAGLILAVNKTGAIILSKTGLILENLTRLNATLASVRDGIAVLNTSLGRIAVTLDQINATLEGVRNGLLLVNTSLGLLTAKLDAINATLESVRGGLAVINTSLGEILLAINKTGEEVLSTLLQGQERIAGRLVLMNETLAEIARGLARVENGVLVLETSLGNISLRLDAINATLARVEDGVAIVETRIGTLLIPINETLAGITKLERLAENTSRNVILVKTSLEQLKPAIAGIENNTAIIETIAGTIKANTRDIPKLAASIATLQSQVENQTILLGRLETGQQTIIEKLDQLQQLLNNSITRLQTSTDQIESAQAQARRAQATSIVAASLSAVSLAGVGLTLLRMRP